MGISRRAALKGLVVAGAAAAGARPARAAVLPVPPADAVGLLYDATLCIGCKTCVVACQDARGLPADTTGSPTNIYNAPVDLSDKARTVIKLYRPDRDAAPASLARNGLPPAERDGLPPVERDGLPPVEREGFSRAKRLSPTPDFSYVKTQCMHCIDPACTSACMLGALKKREFGIVTYDASLCVGCRYCEVACPFNVPKFQWSSSAPQIVKCELCHERLAVGRQPACTEVCPRHAVIFGKRAELLEEARRRLKAEPDTYVQKIYGETDGGGTQVLYISHVPFEQLGFPALGEEPAPNLARSIQHGVYKGFIAPVALYAALGAVMLRNRVADTKGTKITKGDGAGGRP
jgi:Fe-S-cluster-containing dehydrogenase component